MNSSSAGDPHMGRIVGRMQNEYRIIPAQSRLTPSESEALDQFVAYWRANGIPHINRSTAIRAMILEGLDAFMKPQEASE